MGTITSGIGLISGLDFGLIVDQLIAIEARPRNRLLLRIGALDAQRTALLDISARILGMQSRINSLIDPLFFRSVTSTSSDPNVLTVSAGKNAQIGAYRFTVRSLAASHQMVSGGFRTRDAILPRGSLMIESAAARVNNDTTLAELNGFGGVQRGKFKIIDGDGESATIDLREAHTLGDVVNAINDADIAVSARIERDTIVLSDSTGNTFRVRELDGGHTAADLGFSGASSSGINEITGNDLVFLSDRTPMSELNDGNGVRRAQAGGDFTITGGPGIEFTVDLSGILTVDTRIERLNNAHGVEMGVINITNRAGQETEIDLTGMTTIQEVLDAINNSGAGVTVTNVSSRLIVSDTSEGDGELKIEDVDGGSTAAGLGIAGTVEGDKINGRDILRIETLADVIAAVNFASGNEAGLVVADFGDDGKRLRITNNGDDGLGRGLLIEPVRDESTGEIRSHALMDLGIEPGRHGGHGDPEIAIGRRVIGGLDTVLLTTLNGGQGFAVKDGGVAAVIRVTDATGQAADVDLSNAETLQDVIDAIREADLAIEVGYDSTGTRLSITNAEGQSGSITIEDIGLNFAESIGIAQSGESIKSDNLQRQYVSENTLLEDLNAGLGVSRGRFKITDSRGFSATIDLTRGDIKTLGDVIRAINQAMPERVNARINDTGDGLIVEDLSDPPGGFDFKIEDEGGTAARDLNILGETGEGLIDGSFELNIDLNGAETLDDVVALINEQSRLVRANLFNDGGEFNPYRLSITARATGAAGELIIDGSELDLEFSTLSEPSDAVVIVGADDSGLVVRSSSNTIEDIVPGVTLNLVSTSDDPVDVTVERDYETLITTLSGMVSDYNALMDRLDELTSFDPETERRGILLGDGTALSINRRISRLFTGSAPGASGLFNRLSDIGIRMGTGARLEFKEQKFRDALESNPEEVAQFFSTDETGIAHVIKEALESIAGAEGLIKQREGALDRQKEVFSSRIESLNDLLERRRQRLTNDFLRMERALSQLQAQSAALSSLVLLLPR